MNEHYDVVIVGGGMVGASLALALIHTPLRILVIEAYEPESGQQPSFDERTSIVTLSKHGACLVTGYHLDVGMKLLLETPRGRAFKGNVVWTGSVASGSEGQVGVQCRGLAQSLGFQFP